MKAIANVTGLVVLMAVGYFAVDGDSVLATPGPEETEVDVDICLTPDRLELDSCLFVDCGEPEEPQAPEITIDLCVLIPCPDGSGFEFDHCVLVRCSTPCGWRMRKAR